ncbi:hypothetical protein [Streptosporangium sp. CA-115845]
MAAAGVDVLVQLGVPKLTTGIRAGISALKAVVRRSSAAKLI